MILNFAQKDLGGEQLQIFATNCIQKTHMSILYILNVCVSVWSEFSPSDLQNLTIHWLVLMLSRLTSFHVILKRSGIFLFGVPGNVYHLVFHRNSCLSRLFHFIGDSLPLFLLVFSGRGLGWDWTMGTSPSISGKLGKQTICIFLQSSKLVEEIFCYLNMSFQLHRVNVHKIWCRNMVSTGNSFNHCF